MRRRPGEQGFSLVSALFILVVLAFLGVTMVVLSGVQARIPVLALRGAQAYQAALGGLEWGSRRALVDGSCTASTILAVEGFQVTVTCNSRSFTEGGSVRTVFELVSSAESGSYGQADYVFRRVESRLAGP